MSFTLPEKLVPIALKMKRQSRTRTDAKQTTRPSGSGVRERARAGVAPPIPKRIVVPVDFSEFSERALKYAVQMAKEFKAELLLVHVVEAFPIDYMLGIKSAEQANQWQVQQSEKRLREVCGKLTSEDSVAVSSSVKFGKPFQEIVHFASEHQIDLIIIATHGYTGLKHIQLGSTAEMVVRHATCPVLVLPNRNHQSDV
ncbi:MAG TPA: universal stress protein [Candidatus Udaeobacter sp.]|jgi:nucleotide-binding universal stress UspA family protein|nr:universal stress protein [Candidatus Udaeobacter sp.]